jgi:hypothetical protein
LLGLVFPRHFLGVAASRFGRLELLILDRQELCAERGDLFLGGGTHVGGGDHGTETTRSSDRLQAGDADAHDESFRRRHRARRRHHHRQRPVIFGSRVDHRLVAGEVGLAGQDVHRLGARDARHELHREGGDAGPCQSIDRSIVAIGIDDGDNGGARAIGLQLRLIRPAHLQHHIGFGDIAGLTDHSAGLGELLVGNARCRAGAAFHDDVKPQPRQPLHRVGRGSNTRLVRIELTRDENRLSHRMILSAGTCLRRTPAELPAMSRARGFEEFTGE